MPGLYIGRCNGGENAVRRKKIEVRKHRVRTIFGDILMYLFCHETANIENLICLNWTCNRLDLVFVKKEKGVKKHERIRKSVSHESKNKMFPL
jgi:hypothetical protein